MMSAHADATAAIAKLDSLADRLRGGVRSAFETLAAQLLARVRQKLSGEVLEPRSGALRAGIASEIEDGAGGIAARVFSDGSIPYARIQEYGGRIHVPEIVPKTAKALAFMYGGKMVFAAGTAAHVATMPERSYLRSSLAEFAQTFTDDIRKVTTEVCA